MGETESTWPGPSSLHGASERLNILLRDKGRGMGEGRVRGGKGTWEFIRLHYQKDPNTLIRQSPKNNILKGIQWFIYALKFGLILKNIQQSERYSAFSW